MLCNNYFDNTVHKCTILSYAYVLDKCSKSLNMYCLCCILCKINIIRFNLICSIKNDL